MMVKVLLYAYCIGVASSRKIARRLEEDIAFRVLAANNTPDFRTISDFRKDHLKALSSLPDSFPPHRIETLPQTTSGMSQHRENTVGRQLGR